MYGSLTDRDDRGRCVMRVKWKREEEEGERGRGRGRYLYVLAGRSEGGKPGGGDKAGSTAASRKTS